MKALGFGVLCLCVSGASLGCVAQPSAGGPAATGGLAKPQGAPLPTSTDPSMPTSLPPPATATTAQSQNTTYRAGTSLTTGGAALGVAGATFILLGVLLPCKAGDAGCNPAVAKKEGDLFINLGIAALVVGAVGLAVGIPLMVAGAKQVRAETTGLSVGPRGLRIAF